MRPARALSIAALALYVLALTYTTLSVVLRVPVPHFILSTNTLAFFVFAVAHASDRLGTRTMLVFLICTLVVSFVFETIGVLTGWIYGPYYYTERSGFKLGVVPVLVPLAWFMMMYASNTLAEVIADGASGQAMRGRLGWAGGLAWNAWLALLAAMAMTAWDLGMDPQMVASGHWVWTQGGAYFGIPVAISSAGSRPLLPFSFCFAFTR